MSNHKYAAEFREEAVRQVLERGYSVKEVADNLGVSRHSLYKWVREAKPSPHKQKEEEPPGQPMLSGGNREPFCAPEE